MNGIAEAQRQDCFLCAPNENLVFHRGGHGYAVAGLGPQVRGYTVVGSHAHLDALTEMSAAELREHLEYNEYIRGVLIRQYGAPCLLTEHGKTPLCTAPFWRTKHCFHPHALLFPGIPALDVDPRKLYGKPQEYTDFVECINATRDLAQYFLLSPHPGQYLMWPTPGSMPAQYARSLVAAHVGHPAQVSWINFPEFDDAVAYAAELRQVMGTSRQPERSVV